MCVAALVSFTVSVMVGITGIASLRKVRKQSYIFFACIPFIFSMQQFTEGFLWLSLKNISFDFLHLPATYLFLFFAQVAWPLWVPFSLFAMEKKYKRRRILAVFLFLGFLISCTQAYGLLFYKADSFVRWHHIHYELSFPFAHHLLSGFLYFIPTVVSPFISGNRKMRYLGIVILISFLVSKFMFQDYSFYVWCYFAAIISLLIYFIMQKPKKDPVLSVYYYRD